MIPHIPQELVEAIIEEVDQSALTRTALTASALLEPSQRRIFYSIDFYSTNLGFSRHFDSLCTLLTNSTHLASYVRAVVVRLHPTLFHKMARLLRVCPRLKSLAIYFTTQVAGVDLSSLPIDLIDALLQQLGSASLDRLEFWGQTGLEMPAPLLHFAITSVHTLALRRVKIIQSPDSKDADLIARYRTSSTVRLEHLIVDLLGRVSISAECLLAYQNFGFLEGLQKLTLVSWSDRFVPLLEAISPTIRELRIDLAAALWQGDAVFPHFAALRAVEVRVPVDDPEWDNTQASPTIERLLISAPLLERITIFYKALSDAPLSPRVPPTPWSIFDSHLHPFPHLRAVECRLCLAPSFQGDRAVARAKFPSWIGAQMPALRGTAVLTCSQAVLPEKYASWDTWPA